jgi:hypothetical protein
MRVGEVAFEPTDDPGDPQYRFERRPRGWRGLTWAILKATSSCHPDPGTVNID